MPDRPEGLSALVVDYGGVLTSPLQAAMNEWCETDDVAPEEFARVMGDLLCPGAGAEAAVNPVHALERGEITIPDFEAQLAARLRRRTGRAVPAAGLLPRMLAGLTREPGMVEVVRRARAQHGRAPTGELRRRRSPTAQVARPRLTDRAVRMPGHRSRRFLKTFLPRSWSGPVSERRQIRDVLPRPGRTSSCPGFGREVREVLPRPGRTSSSHGLAIE